ncbi:MAG: FecR family protein [Rhodocyclaceae bacterium]|nr:FecR family protein [Rhodocyclaceae bacterium]
MRLSLLFRCLLLLIAALPGIAAAEPMAVGKITFKLGEAWRVARDGARQDLESEQPVYLGETLETGSSGHVHVRFVDGGVVSVRPASRLFIEDYRAPQAGAVRFRLERGAVRTITGRYGAADRARFRLNTPIAAIGIQGTDFIVASDERATRVAVHAGAIIAAPFSADCRPEDSGPCHGAWARTLTAVQRELMLEIKPDQAPALMPKSGLAYVEEARKIVDATAKSEAITQAQAEKSLAPNVPATFAWARWPHAPAWEGETMVVPKGEAAAGRERIAETDRYALYRLPQTEPLPSQGRVELVLAATQAHFLQGASIMPAQVSDGRLTLDFAMRRFDTTLMLEAAAVGKVPFAASGWLRPDGSFLLIEWQNRLWGAYGVGGSGARAGYAFEKTLPTGVLTGITLWR